MKTIAINAVEIHTPADIITYEEIISYRFGQKADADIPYSVTYYDPQTKQGGSMSRGEQIEITNGLLFSVHNTSNA